MNTVTFKKPDGTTKNSYADWGLLLRPKQIAPPDPKIIKMEIEGRDGDIDLTEWAGEVRYNDRTFPLSFYMTCALHEIEDKATDIKNWLHGQRVRITFADDSAYYYEARVSVANAYANGGLGVLDMSVTAEPYKYKQDVTSKRVWLVNGAVRAFTVDRMTTRPRFIAEGGTAFNVCGKNILKYPYSDGTKTHNGVTYTVNSDGTITTSGTATADSLFYFHSSSAPMKLSSGAYTFSGCPAGGALDKYTIGGQNITSGAYFSSDTGNGCPINLTESLTDIRLYISIRSGVDATGLVFKPQLERGSTKTDYEPYRSIALALSAGTAEYTDILFKEGVNTLYGTGAGAYVTVEYQEGAL